MLIQKELKDYGIDENRTEGNTILLGSGKILKIFVEFEKEATGSSLIVFTNEGEVVLNVGASKEPEVYYPRVNIASQRYQEAISAVIEETQARMEPFYFFGGLNIKVERDEAGDAQKIIKKLTVLYDA